MSSSTKVTFMLWLALADWFLMHAYSQFAGNNILMRESMKHPCFAIWLLQRVEYVCLSLIFLAAIYKLLKKPNDRLLEIFDRGLLAFCVLWPLLVLVAWQIQSMPIIGLQGFK